MINDKSYKFMFSADFSFKFVPAAVSSQIQPSSTPSPPSNAPPIGLTPRGSGIDYSDLPLKYQRKPISQEEMEYIEVCLSIIFNFQTMFLCPIFEITISILRL